MEEMSNSGLSAQYQTYEQQKCFIGYSRGARWRADIESVCQEVLQGEFGLEPWYADEHPDPTRVLRDKVVEMIANTRYGIYDLSYWWKDDKGEWVMPRNVLIELGMAIALNRPMLLLRHAENEEAGLKLPTCLESESGHILEFSGKTTLKRVLRERLPQWIDIPPEQDWWNRYCIFGRRICEYREAYPRERQRSQETLCCHIADGQDKDRPDFRGMVEEVLGRYDDLTFEYLDALSITKGYDFLFCTLCQRVRSTAFAIYRITPKTPAETFIAIGMSIALEMQFKHEIPKVLLTANMQDVPSLLFGYEVVEAQNDTERKARLQKFVPVVMQKVRKTIWMQRPLPFIEVMPRHDEKAAFGSSPATDDQSGVRLTAAFKTDIGKQREINEDRPYTLISEDGDRGLFIVADGLDKYESMDEGQSGEYRYEYISGEIASQLAVEKISEGMRSFFVPIEEQSTRTIENQLIKAFREANMAILRHGDQHSDARGLGCTVTTAFVNNNTVYIANIGDSRTYLFRNGELAPLTRDHSLVARLVEAKQIEPEDVYTHPQRNLIYRSLGAGHKTVDPDVFHERLQTGDTLLLCSDGLWEMVHPSDLIRVLREQRDPQKACDILIDLANANGGEDNITALVIQVRAD
jgi:serine/threonine protein phosphatase PrpC